MGMSVHFISTFHFPPTFTIISRLHTTIVSLLVALVVFEWAGVLQLATEDHFVASWRAGLTFFVCHGG